MVSEDKRRWRFPLGGYGEVKGINDAGVETFGSNTLRSLVRESLQNSLDASREGVVTVEFQSSSMNTSDLPDVEGLRDALQACKELGGDNSEAAHRFLNRALKVISLKRIPIMRISDHGTTGLRGADTCRTGTDWSRLIKESGSSSKSGTSGGSFGIGKYAPFTCSELRSVLFSSLDDAGVASHVGVSRLISWRDPETGQHTTGVGYYSDSERNEAIPGLLSLVPERTSKDPGTDILVLGFHNDTSDKVKNRICACVLTDFLVSVWKGMLRVVVGNSTIDASNLGSWISRLNEYDQDPLVAETIHHYSLLTSHDSSVHVIDFDPKDLRGKRFGMKCGWGRGSCRLFLKSGDDSLNREVTVTRAAGMRIFNQNRISGSIRFTGILMIEGDAMNRDFKEMEAPSHDEWSTERADDPDEAQKKINALKMWVKDTVTKTLSVKIADEVEAYGTALYLPMRDRKDNDDKGEKKADEALAAPVTIVRQRDITPKNDDRIVTVKSDVTRDPAGDAIRKGEGKTTEHKVPPAAGTEGGPDSGYTRVRIRQRLMCTDRNSGSWRLSFTVPHTAKSAKIVLCIDGERGEEFVALTSAKATGSVGESLEYSGNQMILGQIEAGDHAVIDFTCDYDRYCMMGADYYEAV